MRYTECLCIWLERHPVVGTDWLLYGLDLLLWGPVMDMSGIERSV